MDIEEPFGTELAIALDCIDTLSGEECALIISAMSVMGCEPVAAFLSLHGTLSHVLASPHGVTFRSLLRSWGANRLLDAAIKKHWPVHYRPQYRPGALTARGITQLREKAADFDLIGGNRRPNMNVSREQQRKKDSVASAAATATAEAAADAEAAEAVKRTIAAGDLIVIGHGSGDTREVIRVSGRGTLYVRKPGGKAVTPLSIKTMRCAALKIEVVGRRQPPTGESDER
jgi:hypothetical protein